MAQHDVLVACVSGMGGVVLSAVKDLMRDGMQARREARVRVAAAEESRIAGMERTMVELRDQVAGLAGLVAGQGKLDRRRT